MSSSRQFCTKQGLPKFISSYLITSDRFISGGQDIFSVFTLFLVEHCLLATPAYAQGVFQFSELTVPQGRPLCLTDTPNFVPHSGTVLSCSELGLGSVKRAE